MRTRIDNGMIYDGKGGTPYPGGILAEDGRIVEVFSESPCEKPPADLVIDAKKRAVCPAFVDIHRHCDVKPFSNDWRGETELLQGIGTCVTGNCGMSMTPASKDPDAARAQYAFQEPVLGPMCPDPPISYPEYARALSGKRLPLNMAAMIGTGSVRTAVKGFSQAPFTPAELDIAEGIIDEALAEGAPGVSLGIMYLPECYTTPDEYVRILRPVGRRRSLITTHIRGEGDSLLSSVREVIDIAGRVGCALEISHFKACGVKNWKSAIYRAIDLIEDARARGQDVTCDFYPYDGGSTALTTMLPSAFVEGDLPKALLRLGTGEGVQAFRQSVARTYPDWDNYAVTLGWERIMISGVHDPDNQKFLGMTVEAAAKAFGFDDACALAAHLMHTDEGKTSIINMSMCQDDIDAIARLPYSIVISDAIYARTDTPHPRMYGAMPRMIRDYAVKRSVIPLETAIHKMTALPARRMKLNAGVLEKDRPADILIFDPDVFRDNATYDRPAQPATGLDFMFLNGKTVVEDSRVTNNRSGRFIKVRHT
ncbi:MAG: amidohydrolase family protein [Clostridia bacterium]|nr:amidohydrolase family protein [Clostridia bacterium]